MGCLLDVCSLDKQCQLHCKENLYVIPLMFSIRIHLLTIPVFPFETSNIRLIDSLGLTPQKKGGMKLK